MYDLRQTSVPHLFAATVITAIVFALLTPRTFAQTRPTPNVPPPGSPGNPITPEGSGTFTNEGIFSCVNAGRANIGTTVVRGGIYVPVRDADVILNTGYLVYKECVLDGMVARIKNNIVAGLQSGAIRAVEVSRGGNKQYVESLDKDLQPYYTQITINLISEARAGAMCNAFKGRVPTAVARNYYNAINSAGSVLACPFTSDADRIALVNGSRPVNWGSMMALVDPTGYEVGEFYILKGRNEMTVASYDSNIRQMLNWGRGMFPAFDQNGNPLSQKVITPAFIIADSLQKMIGLGTDILVNANEIDQINDSLQAGLQASIVADTIRGLVGFSRSTSGQLSYLDRMTASTAQGVRTAAVNTALITLTTVRQVEMTYKSAKEGIAQALIDAINKLRAAEQACWGLIVPRVQERATQEGVSLRIATTTQFSQAVIANSIQELATATANDIRVSTEALNLINQLIASVSNSSSPTAQQQALLQLESLITNNRLHTASQAEQAQKQRDEVTTAINGLVEQTIRDWGDSQDPQVGWCNVNNPAVIDRWFTAWRI